MSVVVRVPPIEKYPWRIDGLAVCLSAKSRFEFWLPPGSCQLEAEGGVTVPRNTHRLNPYNPVTLAANLRDVESEDLELTPKPLARNRLRVRIKDAKEKGTWVGIQERYGSPAPD